MKLVSFVSAGRAGYGVVKDGGVVDLGRRLGGRWPTLRALIAADSLAEAARAARDNAPDFPLEGLELAPVIPDPDKIVCVGLNYREHVEETGRTVTEKPLLFARFAGSQVGHLRPMVKPKVSDEFDYEGELAVVIGKGGRHISVERALDHVAGYACYNDGSIRDWQRHTSQYLPGKNFAGSGAFGPWLVTTDEIPDPTRLTLETRLNGQVVQHATTDLMITPVPEQIAYISTILPLLSGDVIVSGTPGGVGARRKPPLFMRPGDVAEVEITGIGVLRNPIVAEAGLTAPGYIGVRSARLDDWGAYATRLLGMQQVDRGGAVRAFRVDDRKQRLVVTGDEGEGLGFLGWETADAAAIDALAARLDRHGVKVSRAPRSLADKRRVADDPPGNRLEAFHGPAVANDPLRPGRPISGFRKRLLRDVWPLIGGGCAPRSLPPFPCPWRRTRNAPWKRATASARLS